MGERINRLTLRSFRAVPGELTITLSEGRSLLILGDNGTGKSSVGDALEFFFTGKIQPLAREGRGIIHHVGSEVDSETEVEVETTGTLGGTAAPGRPATIAQNAAALENFLLRGRTLAEFIDKTKGDKWKAIFDILGLAQVDQVRVDLQQARNALASDLTAARSQRENATGALKNDCPDPSEDKLLASILTSAERAGVPRPGSLDAALRQDWTAGFGERAKVIEKSAQAKGLAASLSSTPPFPPDTFLKAWNALIGSIKVADLSRLKLIQAAEDFLKASPAVTSCPLCDHAVVDQDLREHVKAIISETLKWSQGIQKAGQRLREVADAIAACWQQRTTLQGQARGLGIALTALPTSPVDRLRVALERREAVDLDSLRDASRALSGWDAAAIKLTIESLPPVKPEDDALVKLLALVHLGQRWLVTERTFRKVERAVQIADHLHDGFLRRQNAYFTKILDIVSGRVAAIYANLHPHEQISNVAFETAGDKGVEVALDFHGKRYRPPHAVLSESHLNSLGIALFLAMAEAFNERVGFLVLDDIVNSFDIDHRGHLATLLADEFQDRQLIVLTHDHIFYEQLRRRAPRWQKMEFTSWSFEEGPRIIGYDTGGLLEKARERLSADDLQGAATKGRSALEEILQEACEGMAAPLPYRRGTQNDRREAQELIMGTRRGLKDHKAVSDGLNQLLSEIEADLQAALNVEAHAGTGWASRPEIEACLNRLTNLEQCWTCTNCNSKVWSVGEPGAS